MPIEIQRAGDMIALARVDPMALQQANLVVGIVLTVPAPRLPQPTTRFGFSGSIHAAVGKQQ
jgi:hypothetical protein